MELSQLRTFREVAEALSFTRAAQKLNMTQSAVSHQIKALERELGEPLFIRAKGGVRLTDSGQLALSYAERILEEADALRERIRGDEHEPRGRVRAAAATQAFVHLFARLFESFMRDHEGVELSFRTTVSTEQTVADILNGAADVGFASLPVYSPALQVTELFEDELGVVTAARHRLAAAREVGVTEMRRERFILFEQGASIRRATDAFFKRVDLSPDLALESNDTYFIKLMVEHGLGVSVMPSWAVREEVEAKRLSWLRVSGHRLTRAVAVIALGRFQPSPTRAFIEYILEHRERLQEAARPF
ncbi:MAG TPA: LysR family transcriptional regulator [Pyrinomonadaceae bacterium]|jgi:LysR family cyn operon transcriptional activator